MSLRVLVVDDDAVNLRIAARLLRSLGHGGAMATQGEKALELLTQQSFDLMLLDINMPNGLSGLDTLTQLCRQENPGSPRLPVLMVSGQHDATTQAFFAQAGADGFLTKPLDATALADALERLRQSGRL